MFGSISNWINTNVPTVQMPAMPNMPNMPNININMPDFLKKNPQEGDVTTTETTAAAASTTSAAKIDEIKVEPSTQATTSAAAAAAAETTGEEGVGGHGFEYVENAFGKATELGSNLGGQARELGSNLSGQARELGNNLGGQAKEIGSNFGNMLFSIGKKASNNVMNTATHLKDVIEKKTLIGDFAKENEKFVNDKKVQQRREDAALPPWVGYNEEEILKEQIMELSQDTRNFLRSPPPGVEYNFDFNVAYPVAMATLDEDKNLKDMRFKLVPKHINEENFWRNYFYRVSLIKQSTQLDQLNNENNQNSNSNDDLADDDERPSQQTTANQQQHESVGNEFVSDAYEQAINDDEEIQNQLKQLKLDKDKDRSSKGGDDLEDWDKELPEDLDSITAEELEKEINQMIGK